VVDRPEAGLVRPGRTTGEATGPMSTDRPVRFGILGAGRVARDFARGLADTPGATLAAVASRSRDKAEQLAHTSPGAVVHPSPTSLVEDPSIDVVYVATPHHLHEEHCLLSLGAGRAVLCEKPFTVDAAGARRVVAAARDRHLFCMEAMWMRFLPAIDRARELIATGAIGRPRLLHADFGVPIAGDPRSRFFDPLQGGGALLDRGVYTVSLAMLLFGRPAHVAASAGRAETGVDEHTGIVLRFGSGELAVLSSSLTSLTGNAAVVTGTHGSLTIEAPFMCSRSLTIRRYRPFELDSPPSRRDEVVARVRRSAGGRAAQRIAAPLFKQRPERVAVPFSGNGYGYEAAEVVRCLRAGELESPKMHLDDTVAIMEVLDTIRAVSSG
jgi:predicted dehydrogenase